MRERKSSGAFPVRTAARLSGLSPDLIRAWERRYGVVSPRRGPRGARLYSTADIEHLNLLGEAVAAGRSIGDVAGLGRAALQSLVERDRESRGLPAEASASPPAKPSGSASAILSRVLAAGRALAAGEVERELGDGLAALGRERFARDLVPPLLREVGERWANGEFSIAGEHLVSNALRSLLAALVRTARNGAGTSVLLATPAGERHEFGLFLAAFGVLEAGGRVVYLGCDVPAEEVSRAAVSAGVRAVGLSCVAQANRTRARAEIRDLERSLASDVLLWVGGREADAVCSAGGSRATVLPDLAALEQRVRRLARDAGGTTS